MALYIDADACPVKEEAKKVAHRHKMKVFVVSNGGIRPDPHPDVETVVVEAGPDIADKWIADRTGPGDICVTSDIPLADAVLKSGAIAIQPDGEVFTTSSIGNRLAMRDLMQDLRAADPFRQGGGKPFSKADRSRFLDRLEALARKASR
ncbi:YaiI/YqxD family protein [Pontivivens insulae]|uniref:UPF0178 protein POI8812_03110 n=1 Tax=Pontivivens insulae TaxID=1639689 RepID=A0A2R8AF03_9RHOB|nr:YaiI/YqxD family protein [Pontivivens insulae]RED12011.1 hypothetical protein DFR53_2724 [Pontivivens insulae]SPF30767.1 hypothetical protein POI8812_03110 [Pontivivens insulae]